MIKSLNKSDVLVTPFEAQKSWEVDNLNPQDLILWSSQSNSGPISFTYIDYIGENLITNSYCNLALQQQQDFGYVKYQRGIFNTNILYPSSSFYTSSSPYYNSTLNPQNIDGTYMDVIYSEYKHLFYNDYNNFTKTFGMENADVSLTRRTITDYMDVFTIPQQKFGEKIVPNSVKILDTNLDKLYTIVDDGNCNLIVSGGFFSTYEVDSLLHPNKQVLDAKIISHDSELTESYKFSGISLQYFDGNDRYLVTSSRINTVDVTGVFPYEYTWYLGGDHRGLWEIVSNGHEDTTVKYKEYVYPTDIIYYENTFVICKIIDCNNTETFTNLIYLMSGSNVYVPPDDTGSLDNPFPPVAPPLNVIQRLVNTGINSVEVAGKMIDTSYVLYNYIPEPRVVQNINGIPNDISPFSSSFIGSKNTSWYIPNPSIADWIGPIRTNTINYGNTYAGNFRYRIYFDFITKNGVPINPIGFSLSGSWAVDNSASMYINGVNTNIKLNMSNDTDQSPYLNKHEFNITGGFVKGRNYLDFDVYNFWPSGSSIFIPKINPIGLYVEFDKNNALFKDPIVVVEPPEIAVSLFGLRWEMPCYWYSPPEQSCLCTSPPNQIRVLDGDPDKVYNLTLRFRGFVEPKNYTGGTNDGKWFQIGGNPVTTGTSIGESAYNIYKLSVSDPQQDYYLNRSGHAAANGYPFAYAIDYMATIPMRGNATVTLSANNSDGYEVANFTGNIVRDVEPYPLPFAGQFIQMDVESVTS